ncbi:MAG: FtsW/RodA/SpoVE family cell cycle protein [Lachnospiraceae bacterium]
MEYLIRDFSQYIITFCMAIYTYECFAVFRYSDMEDRNGIYMRQTVLLFVIHTIGFLVLYLQKNDLRYLFLYAVQLIVLFSVMVLFRAFYAHINRLTVNNMCLLLSIGFLILTRISIQKSISQFCIVVASLLIGLMIPYLMRKAPFLKRLSWVYAGVGIAALGLVLLVGAVTNGSKISYRFLGFSFQPSEFVKIIFVFFVASMLYRSTHFLQILLSALVAGAHVLILVLSRDLGSALIFFVVYICMLFVATGKWIYVGLGTGFGVVAAWSAYRLFSHVQVRVQAWQNPWDDITGTGYQIAQSLFAVGTGGWFGLGLLGGTPTSIPYAETDFVFAAISEEFGAIFAICLLLVCISCFMMFMNIALRSKDNFYRLLAVGLGITYIFQVFLTVGGGTKFIPLTGVTLPFISYGGSSVLSTVIMFSMIQGLYMIGSDEENEMQ